MTPYIVADAWFAKNTFCEVITKMGFHLIFRFRDDAYLMYPTNEPRTGKQGRPKKYIRPNRNLNDRLFKELIEFAAIAV